jgi:hypothetical protein
MRLCSPEISRAIRQAIADKMTEQAFEEEDAAYYAQYDGVTEAKFDPYGELDSEKESDLKLPKLPLPELDGMHLPTWTDPAMQSMYKQLPLNWKLETGLTLGQCVTIANALILLEDLTSGYKLAYEDSDHPEYFFVGNETDMGSLHYEDEMLAKPLDMSNQWEREHAISVASLILQRQVFAYNIQSCYSLWQHNHLPPSIGTRGWWAELAVRDCLTWVSDEDTSAPGGLLAPANLEKHLSSKNHKKHITGKAQSFAPSGAGLAGDIGSDIKHCIGAPHTAEIGPIPQRRPTEANARRREWLRNGRLPQKRKEAEIVASGDATVHACDEPIEAVETLPSGPIMKVAEPEDFE